MSYDGLVNVTGYVQRDLFRKMQHIKVHENTNHRQLVIRALTKWLENPTRPSERHFKERRGPHQISVRVPPDLHLKVKETAKTMETSLRSVISKALYDSYNHHQEAVDKEIGGSSLKEHEMDCIKAIYTRQIEFQKQTLFELNKAFAEKLIGAAENSKNYARILEDIEQEYLAGDEYSLDLVLGKYFRQGSKNWRS